VCLRVLAARSHPVGLAPEVAFRITDADIEAFLASQQKVGGEAPARPPPRQAKKGSSSMS